MAIFLDLVSKFSENNQKGDKKSALFCHKNWVWGVWSYDPFEALIDWGEEKVQEIQRVGRFVNCEEWGIVVMRREMREDRAEKRGALVSYLALAAGENEKWKSTERNERQTCLPHTVFI